MNLKKEPTKKQLQALLSKCDDNAGSHKMWVDTEGEVHLDLVHPGSRPGPNCKFEFETYVRGNGYTGTKAAEDEKYVQDEFEQLIILWEDEHTGFQDVTVSPSEKATKRLKELEKLHRQPSNQSTSKKHSKRSL